MRQYFCIRRVCILVVCLYEYTHTYMYLADAKLGLSDDNSIYEYRIIGALFSTLSPTWSKFDSTFLLAKRLRPFEYKAENSSDWCESRWKSNIRRLGIYETYVYRYSILARQPAHSKFFFRFVSASSLRVYALAGVIIHAAPLWETAIGYYRQGWEDTRLWIRPTPASAPAPAPDQFYSCPSVVKDPAVMSTYVYECDALRVTAA